MNKVIQLILDSQDNLIALTEDGRIFARVEGERRFTWEEIYPPPALNYPTPEEKPSE